jgi:hypothetical protein
MPNTRLRNRRGSTVNEQEQLPAHARNGRRQQQSTPLLIQRAQRDPASLVAGDVLQLQRTVGNRATTQLLAPLHPPSGGQGGFKVLTLPAQRMIQRAILDPEYEDDVIEIEAEKRRARVSDMQGGKIGKDDPRRRLLTEHLLGTGRAKGRSQGEEASKEAKELGESGSVRAMKGLTGPLEKALGIQQRIGPQGNPIEGVNQDRQRRWGMKAPTPSDSLGETRTSLNQYHQSNNTVFRQHAAQGRAETKAKSLKKELEAARVYTGTEDASVDVTQFDAFVLAKDWVEAEKVLAQIETLSSGNLANALIRYNGLKPKRKTVNALPSYHKPADLNERISAVQESYKANDWVGIGRKLSTLETVLNQAISFDVRLKNIESKTALLTNLQQKNNMEEWIALHRSFTWDQVIKTLNSTHDKGGLAYLEDRLLRYSGRAAEAEAAALLEQQRKDRGLIAEDGTLIEEITINELGGAEKTAVEAALNAYDGGTVPVLTHSNGMKWGETYNNRDGTLPGKRGAGGYREYYVQKRTGDPTYHGSRRLVRHNTSGRFYYTNTHYGDNGQPAFRRIR